MIYSLTIVKKQELLSPKVILDWQIHIGEAFFNKQLDPDIESDNDNLSDLGEIQTADKQKVRRSPRLHDLGEKHDSGEITDNQIVRRSPRLHDSGETHDSENHNQHTNASVPQPVQKSPRLVQEPATHTLGETNARKPYFKKTNGK